MKKLRLYFNTVKHMKASQIYYRLKFRAKRKTYKRFNKVLSKGYYKKSLKILSGCRPVDCQFQIDTILDMEPDLDDERLESLLNNEFIFINQSKKYDEEIDWHDKEVSQLWKYNLHYFAYLKDLGAAFKTTEASKYFNKFKEIINSWINSNPLGTGDSWHPYPASLRTVNWITSYKLFEPALNKDQEFKKVFLQHIIIHWLYIKNNFEFDVRGNHLLENIRAYLAGSIFLDRPDDVRQGKKMLFNQMEEQILDDGGHFERAPMYHLIVLEDLLEMYYWLKQYRKNDFLSSAEEEFMSEGIGDMISFLQRILHPDGRIPLFNDSALNIARRADELFAIADELGIESKTFKSKSWSDSGYYILESSSEDNFLIMDCGKICPDFLPAHGHNDLLSFELSMHEERLIVDSGVYEYSKGKWRDFNRSTRAHNTIAINGEEQSQIWSNFRIASRSEVLHASRRDCGDHAWIKGEYKTYRGRKHSRSIFRFQDNIFIIIDEVKGCEGKNVNSYLHFNNMYELETRNRKSYLLKNSDDEYVIRPFGIDNVETHHGVKSPEYQGWYSPEFGVKHKNYVLDFVSSDKNYQVMGYFIYESKEDSRLSEIHFKQNSNEKDFELNFNYEDTGWVINNTQDRLVLKEK